MNASTENLRLLLARGQGNEVLIPELAKLAKSIEQDTRLAAEAIDNCDVELAKGCLLLLERTLKAATDLYQIIMG